MRDLIIIGSGPADHVAGLCEAPAQLDPLVIEGGALMTTTEVENLLGFPDSVLGPDLMDNMRKQLERVGAELLGDYVTRVESRSMPRATSSSARPPRVRTGPVSSPWVTSSTATTATPSPLLAAAAPGPSTRSGAVARPP